MQNLVVYLNTKLLFLIFNFVSCRLHRDSQDNLEWDITHTAANSLEIVPGKLLYLLQESQPIDKFALTLRENDPSRLIGYLPGCFTRIIQQIKKQHDKLSNIINIQVLQVNNHAPSQMQFLCELSSPALREPLEKYEDEFKPMLSWIINYLTMSLCYIIHVHCYFYFALTLFVKMLDSNQTIRVSLH